MGAVRKWTWLGWRHGRIVPVADLGDLQVSPGADIRVAWRVPKLVGTVIGRSVLFPDIRVLGGNRPILAEFLAKRNDSGCCNCRELLRRRWSERWSDPRLLAIGRHERARSGCQTFPFYGLKLSRHGVRIGACSQFCGTHHGERHAAEPTLPLGFTLCRSGRLLRQTVPGTTHGRPGQRSEIIMGHADTTKDFRLSHIPAAALAVVPVVAASVLGKDNMITSVSWPQPDLPSASFRPGGRARDRLNERRPHCCRSRFNPRISPERRSAAYIAFA
jgi:hypothetical protein